MQDLVSLDQARLVVPKTDTETENLETGCQIEGLKTSDRHAVSKTGSLAVFWESSAILETTSPSPVTQTAVKNKAATGDCSANGQIFSSSTFSHVNPCHDQRCRLVVDPQCIMQF